MNDFNYEDFPSSDEWLESLDEDDLRFILVDFDEEETETGFRWEYQHESTTQIDSVFRKIMPEG